MDNSAKSPPVDGSSSGAAHPGETGSGPQAALPDAAAVVLFPDDEDPPEDEDADDEEEEDESDEDDEDVEAAGDEVDSLAPEPPSDAEDVAEASCFAPLRESVR